MSNKFAAALRARQNWSRLPAPTKVVGSLAMIALESSHLYGANVFGHQDTLWATAWVSVTTVTGEGGEFETRHVHPHWRPWAEKHRMQRLLKAVVHPVHLGPNTGRVASYANDHNGRFAHRTMRWTRTEDIGDLGETIHLGEPWFADYVHGIWRPANAKDVLFLR